MSREIIPAMMDGKREAARLARRNGHKLGRWGTVYSRGLGRLVAMARCSTCGCSVWVDRDGIMGGGALAHLHPAGLAFPKLPPERP